MKKITAIITAVLLFGTFTIAQGTSNKHTRAKDQRKVSAQQNNVHNKGYERGTKMLKDARKRHAKVIKDQQDSRDK